MFTGSHESVLVNRLPLKKEPEFASTDGGSGDGDDNMRNNGIDTDCRYDYGSPEEDPESKVIDVYFYLLEEEPKPELGDGDGGAVDVNCYRDPPKEVPELVAAGDDADADSGRDVSYDCSHCGIILSTRKFKVEHDLRCKVRMQRNELDLQVTKLYQCGYCSGSFVNEEYREQHQQRWCRKRPVAKKKPSNGPYFGCDKCKYVTKWERNLEKHVLKHNKNNAECFTCTQCSFKTAYKSSVTRHMEIHGDTFTYCCSICGKSFRTKHTLDDHLLRQHFDKSDQVSTLITSKIYTCDICDRFRTTAKTDFNKHLATCQKYECPRCPYSTFCKYTLNGHLKTHAEQKDYQCTVCKKQFTRKQQLDSHIFNNHADNVDLVKTITSKVHRCEWCSFKTVLLGNLKKHVRSKHI